MGEKRLFSNTDLRKLIIPLIIEQLLAIVVGLADSIMVASVGEAAVSGVSLVDSLGVLIIQVFGALATGGAVVAGQYLGEKNKKKACFSADQLVLFTILISLAVTLFMFTARNFILHNVFGSADADVTAYASTYLMIITFSVPFIAIYNSCAALFRAAGNSAIPMRIAVLMNAINVAGNAITIYGFKMEVTGAALSTLVSRIVAAVIIILLLRKPTYEIHLKKSIRPKFDWFLIKKILYIGIPNSLENSMFQLGKILVLSLVTTFGTVAITANAVANAIAIFMILPGISIGMAMITVISHCVGARDYEQVRYYTKKLMKLIYISMIAANIVIVCMLPLVTKAYNLSPETSEVTTKILVFYAIIASTIWPASFALPNTLRAANDVKFNMYISMFSMWAFRVVVSYILARYFKLGVLGVWYAMAFDWGFRAICFIVRYKREKWIKKIE